MNAQMPTYFWPVSLDGKQVAFARAWESMDSHLRDLAYRSLKGSCTAQKFLDRYIELHNVFKGEAFLGS